MAACTKRVMEATKGLGQRGIKGDTNDLLLFLTVDLTQIFWINLQWMLVKT